MAQLKLHSIRHVFGLPAAWSLAFTPAVLAVVAVHTRLSGVTVFHMEGVIESEEFHRFQKIRISYKVGPYQL